MSRKKKNILVLVDWFFPGYKAGGPITSVTNLVKHLKGEFNFKIITSDTDYLEENPYSIVQSNEWVKFNDSTEVYYFSKENKNRASIKKLINETEFDLAYINGVYSFYFSILPLFLIKSDKIIATRGMFSPNAIEVKSYKKVYFIKFVKLIGLYKNTTFHVTAEEEEKHVKQLFDKNKIVVAPNFSKKFNEKLVLKKKEGNSLKLLYVGRISDEKNQKKAIEIIRKIKKGNIVLTLVGSVYSEEYLKECEAVFADCSANIKVEFLGAKSPQEIEQEIPKHHFSFIPTKGENYGHSIVESFGFGLPVIISNKTPWNDLESKKVGWDIPLNKEDKFVEVINKCVEMNQKEYDLMSKNAFDYGKSISEDKSVLQKNIDLFTNN